MNKYKDLEISILSCLLQKPELMNKMILQDDDFKYHKKLWVFLKQVYKKFGCFDINLMYSVVRNKYKYIQYIIELVDVEVIPDRIELYQKQLLELKHESRKENWIIDKAYELANELYLRNIELKDYRQKLDTIFSNADKIFKENVD
jgi:hypothetical protein